MDLYSVTTYYYLLGRQVTRYPLLLPGVFLGAIALALAAVGTVLARRAKAERLARFTSRRSYGERHISKGAHTLARPKSHKYANASCTIRTGLGREEITALCDEAAVQAQSVQFTIRRTDDRPGLVVYTVRTRIGGIGQRGEVMKIQVDFADMNGQTGVKTSIAGYTLKRSWPLPWQMLAWSNYRKFMTTLALLVKSSDASCTTTIVELGVPVTENTGGLASANQVSTAMAPKVVLCAPEWMPADTVGFNDLTAMIREAVSIQDLFVAASPSDLPKATRRVLRIPLDTLSAHLRPKEQLERVAAAKSGTMWGLLTVTNQRLLFLDQIAGTLELEIPLEGCNASVSANSLLVQSLDGIARFVRLSPTSLPALQDPDVVAEKDHGARRVPRLRVCSDCNAEFTPALVSDSCPDCGGDLQPVVELE